MVRTAISPNFFLDPELSTNIMKEEVVVNKYNNDLNTKIAVYQDRVNGWFLDIAELLKDEFHSGFVILMICMSQLEGIEQFRRGKKTNFSESKEVIKDSLRRIFTIPSQHEKALEILVNDVRHGLFHDGMVRKKILINSDLANAILLGVDGESILINPHLFLTALKIDFDKYITHLTDSVNVDLRKNFETLWDEIYS
ncbi:hypothetical protein KAT80_02150 [Candidatus Pacearchaeota archaeon]|nr:hypothetical protein [Candidatus Pacearchaeota archaeon]